MTTTHVSALTLDRLALGDRDPDAEAHLAGCPRCRADQEAALAHREHFTVAVLPRTQPSSRRRSWRWIWAAAPALVAVVLVLLATRHHDAGPAHLGIKGDAAFQVFANRSGETFAVHDRATLAAGDRIRFVVTPNGANYLLVASIDGAGAASIYYPYRGSQSEPITGARVELPGSIVLDAAPGPERLYAIFSDDPIGADLVTERLRAIGAGGADAIRRAGALDLPSRAQVSLVFEKAPP